MVHFSKYSHTWITVIFLQVLYVLCVEGGEGCDICSRRGVTKCPNAMLKGSYTGVFPDEATSQENETEPRNDKFLDLMMGVLRSMHSSSQADLRRARQKEALDTMMRIQQRRLTGSWR